MEVLDIGLKIPATLPPNIVMAVVFPTMKILGCMKVTEDMDIGFFIPATINLAIVEFIIVVIELVTVVDMDI